MVCQRLAGQPSRARSPQVRKDMLQGMRCERCYCPAATARPSYAALMKGFVASRSAKVLSVTSKLPVPIGTSLILASSQQHSTPRQPFTRFQQGLVQVLFQLRLGRQLGPVFGDGDAVFVDLQQFHLFTAGFSAQDEADGWLFLGLALELVQPFQVQLHLPFVRGFETAQLEFDGH